MGRKVKYSKEIKIEACKQYLSGKETVANIIANLNVAKKTFRLWTYRYRIHGDKAFEETHSNRSYTVEEKKIIIKECMKYGITPTSAKYNMALSVLEKWIKMYNNGEELKEYNLKREVYSMKSRKVTIEEKKEIINYVIAHSNDYKGAAYKYSVPYHDVFNWVKKYNQSGETSLSNKRGRPKKNESPVELTEIELLKIELEKQKQINARLELANEILKKNIQIREKLEKDSQK